MIHNLKVHNRQRLRKWCAGRGYVDSFLQIQPSGWLHSTGTDVHHNIVLCFLINCTAQLMGSVGQVQAWTEYVIRGKGGVPWLMGKADFGQVNQINSQPQAKQEQSRVLWRASCGWWERQTLGRKRKVMYVCYSLKGIKNAQINNIQISSSWPTTSCTQETWDHSGGLKLLE